MAREAPGPFLSKSNDLVLVSMFMILTLLFIAAAEDPKADPPDWYEISYYMPQLRDDDNGTPPKVRNEIDIEDTSGQTMEGDTTDVDIEVDHEGVIGLIVRLEWTDDIGDNDELGISISNGTGELDSSQGTSGQLRLELSSDVEGELMGAYTITISAVDCPGIVGPIPVDRDDGNSWSLTVTMVVME